MNRFSLSKTSFAVALSVILAPVALAADWADGLFPVKTHDFGTVAVAAKTEFVFPIRNNTNQDIHISNVRASCGCTTPILKAQWIKKGEESTLTARYNTDSFWGKKGATLTVVIDRPQYAEVQIRVDGYIRRDMVINPGAIEFGKTSVGEPAEASVKIAYAGRGDWQITSVQSPRPFLTTEIVEQSRSGQRVDYNLIVRMTDDAPLGYLRDELIIQTNDRSMPRVPLLVTGQIDSPLTVAPATFSIDKMKPGEDKMQRLLVQGKTPFKITDIVCQGFEIDFEKPTEAKLVHILNVRLVAQNETGDVKQPLVVKTDSGDNLTAETMVTGVITDR